MQQHNLGAYSILRVTIQASAIGTTATATGATPATTATTATIATAATAAATASALPCRCRCRHCYLPLPQWHWLAICLRVKKGNIFGSPLMAVDMSKNA